MTSVRSLINNSYIWTAQSPNHSVHNQLDSNSMAFNVVFIFWKHSKTACSWLSTNLSMNSSNGTLKCCSVVAFVQLATVSHSFLLYFTCECVVAKLEILSVDISIDFRIVWSSRIRFTYSASCNWRIRYWRSDTNLPRRKPVDTTCMIWEWDGKNALRRRALCEVKPVFEMDLS